MVKRLFILLGIATLIVLAESFINSIQAPADELKGPVHWYTFSEAVALQKKKPKMILVDIYTSWCGPAK